VNFFQRVKYNAKWAAALFLAGIFSLWTKRGLIRIYRAFALWFGLIRSGGKRVPPEIYELRLKTCRECPLFYVELGTCGTPVKRDLRRVGCHCYLPEKAKYDDAKCYLDADIEPGYPGGWRDALSKRGRD
jgi:hypothetical protein